MVEENIKNSVEGKEVFARGIGLHVSNKQSQYICKFIKGKSLDKALADLQKVINYKLAVPFKGEIPHRKGMMSGRYPINASKEFIYLIKGLKGSAISKGLELEKTKIYFGNTTLSSRPSRSGGRRAKRTNVILKAKEFEN